MKQTVQTFSTYFNKNLVEAKSAITVSGTTTVTKWSNFSLSTATVSSGSQTVRVAITNLVVGNML